MGKVIQGVDVPALTGARVLVVENEYFISVELEAILTEAGAQIVGPCQTVREALPLVDQNLSAAVLDIHLVSETVAPVAAQLVEHGVPFIYYTGQLEADETLTQWPGRKVVQKPASAATLVDAIAALLGGKTEPQ
jgi:two-component SAPR family response regulator